MDNNNEVTLKHLDFIQCAVTRMNANSFQIKGMSITITAAILALYASSKNPLYFFVTVIPTFIFWFLDAYYLQQERKFRGVYKDVAGLSAESNLIPVRKFEMPLQKYKGGEYCYLAVFWSRTIWPIYFIPLIILIIGGILLSNNVIRLIVVQ
jgi:hypothetical protein